VRPICYSRRPGRKRKKAAAQRRGPPHERIRPDRGLGVNRTASVCTPEIIGDSEFQGGKVPRGSQCWATAGLGCEMAKVLSENCPAGWALRKAVLTPERGLSVSPPAIASRSNALLAPCRAWV
jgi:hypothetical protein